MSYESDDSIREVFLHMYNNRSPEAADRETRRAESLINSRFADDEFSFTQADADMQVPGEMYDGKPEGHDIEAAEEGDVLLPGAAPAGADTDSAAVGASYDEYVRLNDLDASMMDAATDRILSILESNRDSIDLSLIADDEDAAAGAAHADSSPGESLSELIDEPDDSDDCYADRDPPYGAYGPGSDVGACGAGSSVGARGGSSVGSAGSDVFAGGGSIAGPAGSAGRGTERHSVIGCDEKRARESLTYKRVREEKEYASQILKGGPLDCAFVASHGPDSLVSAVRIPFRHNLDLELEDLLDHGGMFFVTGCDLPFFSFSSSLLENFENFREESYTYNSTFSALVLRTEEIDPTVSYYVTRMLIWMYMFYKGRELHHHRAWPSSFALTGTEFREGSALIEQAMIMLKTIEPDIFKGRQPWNREFCPLGRTRVSSQLNLNLQGRDGKGSPQSPARKAGLHKPQVSCWREDFFNHTGRVVRIHKGALIRMSKGSNIPEAVSQLWQRLLYEGNLEKTGGRSSQYYLLKDDVYLGNGRLAASFLLGSHSDECGPDNWMTCRRYVINSRLGKARIECTLAQTVTRGTREVMIFAGSKLTSRDAPGTDDSVRAFKDELIAQGSMKDNGICGVLTDDVHFSRSHDAQAFLAGNALDGAALWKLKAVSRS